MRRHASVLAFVLVLSGSCSASAEIRQVLFSSGDWELIGVDGFEISLYGEDYEYDGVCVARSTSSAGSIDFGMFYKGWAEVAPQAIGVLMGKIKISGVGFEKGYYDTELISGVSTYKITEAEYSGEMIQFMIESQHAPASALSLLGMMVGEDVRVESEVLDEAVVFSPIGFVDVINAMFDCAGIEQ